MTSKTSGSLVREGPSPWNSPTFIWSIAMSRTLANALNGSAIELLNGLKNLPFVFTLNFVARDPHLASYLKSLESSGKPVILTGDLNVAHLDLDIYNSTSKHITKQAGLTPQERQSFGSTLATEFQDALRFFYPGECPSPVTPPTPLTYPAHEGQFTYWSVRTNARPENKGLRLDYFMCSRSMFPAPEAAEESSTPPVPLASERPIVRDSSILHEFGIRCSDHCPISLSLQIGGIN
jgi:exonuclease III